MKTLKGWITTTCLVAMLLVSTITANAGIIFGGNGLNEPVNNNCRETNIQKVSETTSDNLVGIIFGGFVGIIFGGNLVDQPVENCGIIFGG
jgi:hypothetical protein